MIVKGTKQLGNFKRGVNLYIPKRKTNAPPITTSRAFDSSGNQVGSTNTGDIPADWVDGEATVTSVIFANDNSVTNIGSNAFYRNQLTAVTIPSSVTSIGSYAFKYNNLTALTIPNNVTTIGGDAFYGNPLASINIDMTNIPDFLFFSDNMAFSLTMGPNVRTIGSSAFMFNNLTAVTIPNGVTSIGSYAFAYNQLASVSIGTGVTSIDSYAFKYNTSLASVSCFAPTTAFVGSQAFYFTASPLTIRVRSTDSTWDALVGTGKTFQGNTNVTVIKDL